LSVFFYHVSASPNFNQKKHATQQAASTQNKKQSILARKVLFMLVGDAWFFQFNASAALTAYENYVTPD